MIKRMFKHVLDKREEERQTELYRNLIRHEAKIGGSLFGPIPKNHRREFFCFDRRTWVWHEEWIDAKGKRQVKTTRYDVRPNAILKAQDGQPYQMASKEEVKNLYHASQLYKKQVLDELYSTAV
jgi:hypothetical protein